MLIKENPAGGGASEEQFLKQIAAEDSPRASRTQAPRKAVHPAAQREYVLSELRLAVALTDVEKNHLATVGVALKAGMILDQRLAQEDQGRQALYVAEREAEDRLTDGWSSSGWRDAAAEYHAARGGRVSIVEIEPEKLRRLLDDSISIDRAYREINANRPTPQTTIEAVIVSVRERGVKALSEPDTLARLAGCDEAARAEINRRVASLARGAAA